MFCISKYYHKVDIYYMKLAFHQSRDCLVFLSQFFIRIIKNWTIIS